MSEFKSRVVVTSVAIASAAASVYALAAPYHAGN